MSERPRWLTEAARSGSAVDEVPEPRPGAGREGVGHGRPDGWDGCVGAPVGGPAGTSPGCASNGAPRPSAVGPRRCWRSSPAWSSSLGVLVWLVGFSSVLATRSVTVTGLGDPGEQAVVVAAAAVPIGTPLARVDTGGAVDRVASGSRPWPSVSVSRSWPSTVVVSVPAQGRRSWSSRTLKVNYRSWMPSGVPFEVVSALPAGRRPGQRRVRRARPGGHQGRHLDPAAAARRSGAPRSPAITVTSADLVTLQLGPGERGLGRDRRRAQEAGHPRGAAADKPGGRRRQRAGHARSPADPPRRRADCRVARMPAMCAPVVTRSGPGQA